jgi:hypothetical protein
VSPLSFIVLLEVLLFSAKLSCVGRWTDTWTFGCRPVEWDTNTHLALILKDFTGKKLATLFHIRWFVRIKIDLQHPFLTYDSCYFLKCKPIEFPVFRSFLGWNAVFTNYYHYTAPQILVLTFLRYVRAGIVLKEEGLLYGENTFSNKAILRWAVMSGLTFPTKQGRYNTWVGSTQQNSGLIQLHMTVISFLFLQLTVKTSDGVILLNQVWVVILPSTSFTWNGLNKLSEM